MMLRLFLLIFLLLPVPAWAGQKQCYTPAEQDAEQLLRLHTELMVVAITCKQDEDGQDLIAGYTAFTNAHVDALHDAEGTMTAFYNSHFSGNGTARLDKLHTQLANEYGQKIANLSAPGFCGQYRQEVARLYKATAAELGAQVKTMNDAGMSRLPLCGAKGATLAKNP
ncbi:MAG: hypothetical protein JO126_08490 [Alphaproteobacteria bacterium]|nr:hypothetical protein [Alphaproteobacteria bacterium]MBV8549479.1 hypothetical protein [Alphaproteobacteria bacterium]